MRCLVLTENIDVIAVTETFIDTVNNDLICEYNIEEFKFFNKDRVNRRAGGVALFIATWLNPVEIPLNDTNIEHVCVKVTGEHVCVKVTGNELVFNISVTYRPPGRIQELDNEMYRVLRQSLHNSESGILGDFQSSSYTSKLRCKQMQIYSTKFFFTNDIVREWNKLLPSVVQCDTINSFKNKLDHHFLNQGIR